MTDGRIIEGDCLAVLPKLDEGSVALAYLDPPFATGREHRGQSGSKAEKARFRDTGWGKVWRDASGVSGPAGGLLTLAASVAGPEMAGYLLYIGSRLGEVARVLAPTGSLYLHCDGRAVHWLKILADAILGPAAFRNHITWERFRGNKPASYRWPRNGDAILYYARPGAVYTPIYVPLAEGGERQYTEAEPDGRRYRLCPTMAASSGGGHYYDLGCGEKTPRMGYRMPERTARRWLDEGILVIRPGVYPLRKMYRDDSPGMIVGDVWSDPDIYGPARAGEHIGYPTQKPIRLLRRIIEASTVEGDLVLDPFCGSGSALIAADRAGRRWIGIDESPEAIRLCRERVEAEKGLFAGEVLVAEAAD